MAKSGTKAGGNSHTNEAIDKIANLTEMALGSAPENHRLSVLSMGLIAIIAVPTGAGLIIHGEATWGASLVILGIILISSTGLAALIISGRTQSSQQEEKPETTLTWSRVIVRKPDEQQSDFAPFKAQLDDLRKSVANLINDERKKTGALPINADLIRSNIFLPSTDRAKLYCDPLNLFIPKNLQTNMDNATDRDIKFRNSEGLTGRTFTLGEAFGAEGTAVNGNPPTWKRVSLSNHQYSIVEDWNDFELKPNQINMIEKRLRWIVSIPIHPNDRTAVESTLGVLNVDGLDISLTLKEMSEIADFLKSKTPGFASILMGLPLSKISIYVEDVQA